MELMIRAFVAFVLVSMGLIAVVAFRPSLTMARGGKILAFIALFVFPLLATGIGTSIHLEHSKTTEFCLSCHVMEPYGKSLLIDDTDYLPAAHFQNRRVPRDHACFTCHTSYTMFGDFEAKVRGLRHLYVNYLGTIPDQLQLYEPFLNRECLHCHSGARSFEESELHVEVRQELAEDVTSCLECHESTHDPESVDGLPKWKGAPR